MVFERDSNLAFSKTFAQSVLLRFGMRTQKQMTAGAVKRTRETTKGSHKEEKHHLNKQSKVQLKLTHREAKTQTGKTVQTGE